MCDVAITFKTNKSQHVSKTIGAHRAVLSAMSPVFKERILASTGGPDGHILELEHDPGTIEKLLNYIYTGNLMGDCAEVTRCANELEICGIDQLSKFETEVHSGGGNRIYFDNPTLTLKSELSDDDLFEDSDEWDPIAPELILRIGNEPPSSLAGNSSSGEDEYCDPMKFDISMPDHLSDLTDDGNDTKVDSGTENKPSERTRRGRPKGSSAPKRIKALPAATDGLHPPQAINKQLGGSGNNKKLLCR